MPHTINTILTAIKGFSGDTFLGKLGLAAGAAITAFYAPIQMLLFTCFAFTIVDMIYGIKVAKRFRRKIESRKNWKGTIIKLLDEYAIISLAHLLEITVFGEYGVFVLTGGTVVIIALTELWSILENLNTLNPKGPWKALSKFLKKKGEDYIGTEINLNNDSSDNKEAVAE